MQVGPTLLKSMTTNLLNPNEPIYIKELVANSFDASRELMKEMQSLDTIYGRDIIIKIEKTKITVCDGGKGMSEDELMKFLGTIGGSGSAGVEGSIGQFGTGFYSSFLVTDTVKVITRRHREDKVSILKINLHDNLYSIDEYIEFEEEETIRDYKTTVGTTVIMELREGNEKKPNKDAIKDYIFKNILNIGIANQIDVVLIYEEEKKEDEKKSEEDKKEIDEEEEKKEIDENEEKKEIDEEEKKETNEEENKKIEEDKKKNLLVTTIPHVAKCQEDPKYSVEKVKLMDLSAEEENNKKVFNNGTSLERKEFSIQINQSDNKKSATFHVILFLNEIMDMRVIGIEPKGETFVFVNGLKIKLETPDFMKAFNIIANSDDASIKSTRERLRSEDDEKRLIERIMKEIVTIYRSGLNGENRDKLISSYNSYIKSSALHYSREKSLIKDLEKTIAVSASFDCLVDNKIKQVPIFEMLNSVDDTLYYTTVDVELVKMDGAVKNPNFVGIKENFYFASGIVDQQYCSEFKELNGKYIKDLSARKIEEGGDKNVEFEEWIKKDFKNNIAECQPTNALGECPFMLQKPANSTLSSARHLLGRANIEKSIFGASLITLPTLKYNSESDEFISLMNLKDNDIELAKNVMNIYIVGLHMVNDLEMGNKVSGYVGIVNSVRSLVGLNILEVVEEEKEDDKKEEDEKINEEVQENMEQAQELADLEDDKDFEDKTEELAKEREDL